MKTLTEYRAELKAVKDKYSNVEAQLATEGREPTEEEFRHMEKLLDEAEGIEKVIRLKERQESFEERMKEPVKQPAEKPQPTPNITVGENRKGLDNFPSFGEFLAAVVNADLGRRVDPRLWSGRAASGMNEGVPSQGGFLVQQDFSSGILQQVWDTGVLASRCRRIQMSANSNSLKVNGIDETSRVAGSRAGGVRGYWTEEAGEKTASKPKFRKIELNLHKLIGLCYATDELLDDATALENVIRSAFVDEFAFLIDDAIINGTGAGQPLGILNAGCVVSVGAEAGQAATTLVYENIVKMWARLFATSRANAVWLINQDCEPQLHTMSLAVGTGGVPVYLPAGGASASPYSTLFGRPVIPIEQCQTLGTTGDIYLADFSRGYILAEKGGIKSDMSIHVRFIYDESVFRFVIRLDGQPVLASAITPYKGSNTLSHFVKLDTRS